MEAERALVMQEFVAAAGDAAPAGARGLESEFAVDELAAALTWSTRRVHEQVRQVSFLRRELPSTWAVWRAGETDGAKVRLVIDAAERLVDLLRGTFAPGAAVADTCARSNGAELTARPTRSRKTQPVVAVTVPIQSLLGVDDTPGELADGSTAVPASLAREIAERPGTLFYRLLTDQHGQLLDVAELGRFASPLLGFAVDVRDRTCRFPGCTRRASNCDCDHTVRHPDGRTEYVNLGCLCRRHHRCKQAPGYTVRQIEPGVFEWVLRSAGRHTVRPDPLPVGRWPTERAGPAPPPDPASLEEDLDPAAEVPVDLDLHLTG